MLKRQTYRVLCLILFVTLVAAGCGGGDGNNQGGQDSDKPVLLQAGHAVAEAHPYHLGLLKFKEIVETNTDGQVTVEIFPNGTLGSERDMVEGLQMGSIDVLVTSTGPVINFIPEMGLVDLPFLFSSSEHAYQVLDGEVGRELLQKFDAIGIKGLAFWENGFRHLTNSVRPVTSVEDIQGLNIRTMENEVHQAAFKVLGASPTPMAWGEVFTSLQQGTIDGQENPVPIIYTMNIYEVQKYLALTGHFYSPALLLFSQKPFDELTPGQQEICRAAALEAAAYEREKINEQTEEQLALLEEKGMVITKPDVQALREATGAVYEQYRDKFGPDRIEKILAADPNK